MDFYATRISLAPPLSSVIGAMARAGRARIDEPTLPARGRMLARESARTAPSQAIESRGRRLAYRMFGTGPTLVLALRFRGVMDSWDPAFLDALAASFTVVIFDYTGLGLSSGEPSYRRADMARDILDLADGLGLGRFVVGGWSLGGVAAQIFAAEHPERVRQVVLLGTVPPGPQPHASEPIFLETALKPDYDLEDEMVLFFEPASEASRAAARASHARIADRRGDLSPPIPPETYLRILQESHDPEAVFPDPDGRFQAFFRQGSVPVLAISGDHEVVFPVANWQALNRVWPSLHLVTIPQAGHGPQHQMPEFVAGLIAGFVRATPL